MYTYAMNFSTQATLPRSIQRAETDLEKHLETGNVPVRVYVATIKAWLNSQHREAPKRVDTLLREMIDSDCLATGADYTKVIKLCVRNDEPYKAHSILEQMERSDDPNIQPTTATYNHVLNGLCQRGDEEAMSMAEELFHRLRQNPHIHLNVFTFGTMISGWGRNHTNPNAIGRALTYFDDLKRRYRKGNRQCKPNLTIYKTLLNLLVRNDEPHKAQRILEEMERSDDPTIQPDIISYNSVLHGWCKRADNMAMSRADELFDRLRRNADIRLDDVAFATIISGWGHCHTNPHSTDYALAYFEELENRIRNGDKHCKPSHAVYKTLLNLLVRNGEPHQAQRILEQMERSEDPNIQPDIANYNSVLHGWCKSGDEVAMSMAEEFFDKLCQMPHIDPTVVTFGTMISGWGNSHTNPNASDRALAYFAQLKNRYRDGDEHCKPSLAVYKMLLNLLVRNGEPHKAQSILEQMERSEDPNIQPDITNYNSVLHGWCKQGGDLALSKADELFDRLRRNADIGPDEVSFRIMISGWGHCRTNPHAGVRALAYFDELNNRCRNGDEHCTPSLTLYMTVLNLLVRNGEPHKAQRILEEMERSHDPTIQPDIISYNSVLHGWCKQGGDLALSKADELFDRLRRNADIGPDVVTFGTMISGWGRNHTNPNATDRALAYFEELENSYRDGDEHCTPSITLYKTLLNLLVRNGEPHKAQRILEQMERSEDPNIQPDITNYNSVLHGWCKRGDDVALSKAEELFDRLRRIPHIDPDVVTFKTIISGWRNNCQNPLAMGRVLAYFDELKNRYSTGNSNCKPDIAVYKTVIHLLERNGEVSKAQSLRNEMEGGRIDKSRI